MKSSLGLRSFLLGSSALLAAQPLHAADQTWGANAGTAWYTGSNWAGGAFPGLKGTAASNTDIATFTSAATATTFGINMNATAEYLNLGAISLDATRTTAVTIGNSSSTAISGNGQVLRLYGATVGGIDNTILSNAGTGLLTIANVAGGTQFMGVVLSNTTDNIINASTGGVTISSNISELATGNKLTKTGANTLILSGASSYTGATTINGGTLQLGNAGTTGTLSTSSAIINDGTFRINRSNAVVQGTDFATVISGSGAVVQAGSSSLTLSGENTYSGGTTLSAGTLNINNGGSSSSNSAIGIGSFTIAAGTIDNTSGAASSTVTLATNNALALNGNFTYTGTGSRNLNLGTGAVTMASTRQITVSAGTLTIGGNIASTTAGINKRGTGTLVLSGSNNLTGIIDNSASNSTVIFNGGAAMGTGALQTTTATSSTFHIQQDTAFSRGNFIIANGGSTMNLIVDRQTLGSGTGMNYQFTAAVGSTGNQIGGGSSLTLSAGSNITPGTIPTVTFTQGIGSSSRTSDTATATLNPTGVNLVLASLGSQNNGARSWTLGGTTTGNSITGTIGGNTSTTTAFIKNNTSTWTVSGNSTFNQPVSITNGVLKLGGVGSGANSPLGTVSGNTAVTSTGTLDLNGITLVTAEPLSLSGSGTSNSGALANTGAAATFSGPVTLGAAARIVAGGNISLTSATPITSSFGLTLDGTATGSSISTAINTGANSVTKEGSGTWTLSNSSNSYSGATTITGGKLVISSTGNINSTSGVSVGAGATFAYNSSTALTKVPTLNGTGTTSALRAVLGGTGTINAAVTLDNTGDVLSPGNSPGIQTYTPAQSWASFSYDWEINDFSDSTGLTAGSDFDQIVVNDTLNLSGGSGSYILNILSLTAGNANGLVPNFSEIDRSWTILTSTGLTGFNVANWTLITDPDGPGAFTSSPAWAGTFSLGQSGNNLVLSYAAIPEPDVVSLLGGLGMLAVLRRRR